MPPSTRKQQARLNLIPLPTSSQAAQGYNAQIQARAAAVSYDDSSARFSKQRKFEPETNANALLPTPSATIPDGSGSGSGSTQRKSMRRAKKQQQRLDFAPSSGSAVNLGPPMAPNMFTTAYQRGTKRAAEKDESEDSEEVVTVRGGKRRKLGFMSSEGKKVGKKAGKQNGVTPENEDEDEGEDEDEEIVVASAREVHPQPTPQEVEDDDEEEDEIVLPSARKLRRPTQQTVEEEEDSEDELPQIIGTQKRHGRERQSSILNSSPPAAIAGSEDELQIIEDPRKKKNADKNRKGSEDEEESEEEDVAPRTPGRRLQRRNRQMTQQEQEDLNEDMDFIGPSSDVDEGRTPRDSQTMKKNARLQALQRLKLVRSSQKTGLPDIREDEQEEAKDTIDQQEVDEMYDNSDEGLEPAPTSSRAMFAADEDDEDFIEEGEDDILGVPDGIPLAFTRYASMKAKDLWKFAIEWFVQKKINPAFAMDDEIYTLTFQKLDDEVSGLVRSKFASSAWTGDFTIAVRSRPEIAWNSIDRNSAEHAYRDKCDACNRSGHPATREVQFQGKPYNRQTLDEVGKDDDDDDSGDDSDSAGETKDDRPAYDAQGRQVPPANKVWYVGKFCMSNARTAHSLHHWRFHLYEWVVQWIDGAGYSSVKELKKRDKMSTKKRRKYANKIVDRMVEEGVVKKLWKEFRGTIDEASNAKQGRFEGGSP